MERCGYVQGDSKEIAPIFTQFLDCVWQLTCQFPCAFEFNERFLITIHDHVYSAQYGTFIGNCEKDRLDLRIRQTTYSLWGNLAKNASAHRNPLWSEDGCGQIGFLDPQLNAQSIRYWRGMYNRFESGVHPREPVHDILAAHRDHSTSMNDHALYLLQQIEALRKEVGDAAGDTDNISSHMNIEHPLASLGTNSVFNDCDSITNASGKIDEELRSVAVDWSSLRKSVNCSCNVPSDYSTRKFQCWSCGSVFCQRCLDKQLALPGHGNKHSVTVCRACFKQLTKSASLDTT